MNDPQVLRAEQEYTQRVQQLLLSVIEQSTSISADHAEAVHMIVADAWDELRMKPTALWRASRSPTTSPRATSAC